MIRIHYVISFALLALIYFLIFYKKWSKKTKKVLVLNTLMYIYIVMVLFVTVMPFTFTLDCFFNLFMGLPNIAVFNDLILSRPGSIREIILNIIMMMPFGFLYPIVKTKGVLKTVFMTFIFSLTIECFQLLSICAYGSRSFDVTDLITNTIGGFVGYIIYIIFRPLVSKIIIKIS